MPGVADWTGKPTRTALWRVQPDQLFEQQSKTGLNCDDWLAQQVVLFDGRPISLKKIIQTVANYDGAHSVDVGRLATPEGHNPSKAAREPAPNILNAITIFGLRFLNLIVIEAALYLYQKLLDLDSLKHPQGKIGSFSLGFACEPEQAESLRPDWLRFQGTMMISFSGIPNQITHEIKAIG